MSNKTFTKLLLRFFFVLMSMEIALRILDFGYYFYHEKLAVSPIEAKKDEYRIVCIGESTVQGHPGTKEEAFPSQLELILKKHYPETNIKVYNLGIGSIVAERIKKNTNYNINNFSPDLVVLLIGHNLFYLPYLPAGCNNKIVAEGIIKFNSLKIIRLFRLLSTIVKNSFQEHPTYLFGFSATPYTSFKNVIYNPENDLNSLNIGTSAENIVVLDSIENSIAVVKKIQRRKVKILLCNYFDSWANDFLHKIAKGYKLPFCDNNAIYLKHKRSDTTQEIFTNDKFHPSPKGYRLMAENIADSIIKLDLIRKK